MLVVYIASTLTIWVAHPWKLEMSRAQQNTILQDYKVALEKFWVKLCVLSMALAQLERITFKIQV